MGQDFRILAHGRYVDAPMLSLDHCFQRVEPQNLSALGSLWVQTVRRYDLSMLSFVEAAATK